MQICKEEKTNLECSLRGKSFTGHIDSSFSARVTRFVLSEAQIDILNYPVTTSTHASASFLPPVMSVRTVRCTVHVWRYRTAHVANDYQNRSTASGYNVQFSNQGAALQDPASHAAALCFVIAGSWVSHVKWQAGKCEIPDKAQSLKKP